MTADSGLQILAIIAHARSGALERAWRLFGEAGLDRVADDPAVLSVKGRLLKDRALAAAGEARRALYLEAAQAYSSAAAIDGATYPLINAATLSLLAGQPERAGELARKVLEKSLRDTDEAETPYWRAATRAEALLLLGDVIQAKDNFRAAIALAPLAYEDHASTLRQFGLILDELGLDKTWLDANRPPRSLHFAGHMALSSGVGATGRTIRTLIKEERIGFGYGALAAGADILIAEALLEAGAELHLLLPGPVAQFRAGSVVAYGENWAARFDDVLKSADTVRALGQADGDPLSPLAIRLAAEVAMGSAVMQAAQLMSEAVQLLVLERAVRAGTSGAIGQIWAASGGRQHIVLAPRTRATKAKRIDPQAVCLAAALRIELSARPGARPALQPLEALATTLASGPAPAIAPRWTGETVLVAYDTPGEAAQTALAAANAMNGHADFRIAGHYALATRIEDPFGPVPFLTGTAPDLAAEIALSTSSGAIHVSEDFAAALYAGPDAGRPRTELVGELPGGDIVNPLRLFSLRR